jgi:hypothetical protein
MACWAFRLGVASALAVLLALLALTDIGHDEADVTLEWNVLRVAFLVIIAFHVVGLAALRGARRQGAVS